MMVNIINGYSMTDKNKLDKMIESYTKQHGVEFKVPENYKDPTPEEKQASFEHIQCVAQQMLNIAYKIKERIRREKDVQAIENE
jgi:hypothetical protein